MKKLLTTMMVIGTVAWAFAGDFPVDGDGAAIQKAIDRAAAAGGGRVVVAPGVHPSGSLVLKSHVELHLSEGAVILGSTKLEDYADFPKDVCSVSPECSYKVLLQAWDAEDIAVTGKGMIDGRGPAFYPVKPPRGHWPKPKTCRPIMVQFVRCKGVRLEGVTFKDSALWTMFIRLCENIAVDGITVVGDQRMINNDGIDFDACKHVRVGNSRFRTGDDCLILRSMRETPEERVVCEDVVVSNCVLNSTCQTIRMGCSSDDVIRNAKFLNIKASGMNGIFFDYPARYLRPYDEGFQDISDILFDGYEGEFTGSPVQIVVEPGVKIRGVRDVTFRNFKVKGRRQLRFVGNHDSVLKNITVENLTAEVAAGRKDYDAAATEPLVFRNTTINGKRIADGELVTPRGKRLPLKRRNGGSWETLRQKK